ncbi:alpha/beta hydrolase [Bradyrhizobium sp. 2TAF24]|uniref:alpha/beta hydrolase n=1 Tax=Bradyrhizobium sp. 2TAF24 TaxID=3233011 RepID=UPI003F8E5465
MATGWSDTAIETGETGDLPVRVYRDSRVQGSAPLVFHLHGGAFSAGTLQTCDIVPELLAEAGAVVVSADYPLAPLHRFPEALRTLFGSLTTLRRTRARWAGRLSRLFVAGEEAGGNLAASLALMARDQRAPELAGQILLSPMLDPCLATTSIRSADVGPAGCKWSVGWQNYLGSPEIAAHPYAAPSQSSRLAGLPSTLMVTAQDDPMRDESLSYAARLREAGVAVREHVLSAPTAWPDALCSDVVDSRDWAAGLRGQFKEFLADFAAPPRRSASRQLVEV